MKTEVGQSLKCFYVSGKSLQHIYFNRLNTFMLHGGQTIMFCSNAIWKET